MKEEKASTNNAIHTASLRDLERRTLLLRFPSFSWNLCRLSTKFREAGAAVCEGVCVWRQIKYYYRFGCYHGEKKRLVLACAVFPPILVVQRTHIINKKEYTSGGIESSGSSDRRSVALPPSFTLRLSTFPCPHLTYDVHVDNIVSPF